MEKEKEVVRQPQSSKVEDFVAETRTERRKEWEFSGIFDGIDVTTAVITDYKLVQEDGDEELVFDVSLPSNETGQVVFDKAAVREGELGTFLRSIGSSVGNVDELVDAEIPVANTDDGWEIVYAEDEFIFDTLDEAFEKEVMTVTDDLEVLGALSAVKTTLLVSVIIGVGVFVAGYVLISLLAGFLGGVAGFLAGFSVWSKMYRWRYDVESQSLKTQPIDTKQVNSSNYPSLFG